MFHKTLQGLLVGTISAAIALLIFFAGQINWLENVTWDLRVRYLAKESPATDNVKLIFLDQKSLDWGAEDIRSWPWPWPRTVYTAVINFCRRGGAKAIVFDITFTEQSQQGVEDDTALGNAYAESGHCIQAFELGTQGSSEKWPDDMPAPRMDVDGTKESSGQKLLQNLIMPKATFPITEIGSHAAILGNVSGIMDDDAIIRRIAPFRIFDGKFIPSLALAAFLTVNPDQKMRIENNSLYLNDRIIPIDSKGRSILKFRGPTQTHETRSMASIIHSELQIEANELPLVNPNVFSNSYVFVGMTATGLRDLKPVPMAKEYPGVEIHATFLDNILANDLMRDASPSMIIACALIFALLAGSIIRLCTTWKPAIATIIILTPLPVAAGFAMYTQNIWLPIAPSLASVVFASIAALVTNYAVEGRQKRFLKSAFKQYLSPTVIERLVRNPKSLKLGGELRELSILFSDVQGFTSISESLNPEDLTSLLNYYLSAMTSIIYEENGTIDKYEGDAIIAFWNAPLDDPNHASNAVRAALRCNALLAEMRPKLKEQYGKDVYARIGINTGPVVIGNMGSEQRFNYTFLGDAGNLASRLEGANKQFDTHIMISEFTAEKLNNEFDLKEIAKLQVKGKAIPVRVFEPSFRNSTNISTRQDFSKALSAYYNGDLNAAEKLFGQLSATDPTAAIYLLRCQELMKNTPVTWDGIWIMTEK